jgi:hypothetical protein
MPVSLGRELSRIVPVCLVLGASMELFMIKTGFYEIVTRKEAERQAERDAERERREKKLRSLKFKKVS